MNSFLKLIIHINQGLIHLSKKGKDIIFRSYKYLMFIFNKRETIRKIYEPIIKIKEDENQNLISETQYIKNKSLSVDKDITNLNTYINNLKNKVREIEKDFIN
jgi:hypothetical protein